MKAFRAETLTELHQGLCHYLVHARKEQLDVISSVDVQKHNTISEAQSMDWDFDLKSMWLTKGRWSMMVRQYLDPVELQAWIEQITGRIGTRGRGIAVMRTKAVKGRGGDITGHTNKATRRWGSCMLAVGYKAMPRPQITLYSRTSYLGYLGALDLSVAWMCGKYLAKELGVSVEDFAFVWMNEALQYHNFKSLAYLLNHPDEDERKIYRAVLMRPEHKLKENHLEIVNSSPALTLSRKWLQKLIQEDKEGKTLGDMTYNTYRRIRRRFHTEVKGFEYAQQFEGWSYYKQGEKKGEQKEFFAAYKPLPSVNIHDLDFSSIKMPLTGEYGADFQGEEDEFDEDDG